jgi:hypothetical protein
VPDVLATGTLFIISLLLAAIVLAFLIHKGD